MAAIRGARAGRRAGRARAVPRRRVGRAGRAPPPPLLLFSLPLTLLYSPSPPPPPTLIPTTHPTVLSLPQVAHLVVKPLREGWGGGSPREALLPAGGSKEERSANKEGGRAGEGGAGGGSVIAGVGHIYIVHFAPLVRHHLI